MSRYLKLSRIIRHAQTEHRLAVRKALRADPYARGWMTRRGGL